MYVLLLQLEGDGTGAKWKQVLADHGHIAPPREFLDALATWALAQAKLPLRRGGLGLTSAVETSKAAYLRGMAAPVNVDEGRSRLHTNCGGLMLRRLPMARALTARRLTKSQQQTSGDPRRRQSPTGHSR